MPTRGTGPPIWRPIAHHVETKALAGMQARTSRSCRCGPSGLSRASYDHMEGERFRHTAQFKRWRTDRDPSSCTYAQLEQPLTFSLAEIVPGVVLGDA
jgi:hypothetical protein